MAVGTEKIPIGVSSCLLGQEVRFDGGHKRDAFLTGTLTAYVEFVPVCPELEAGMGVPREPVRLVGPPDAPRMVGTRSQTDFTSLMTGFSRKRTAELEVHDLCGYILKKNSPSCGMERVKIYAEGGGVPSKQGVGLFAQELMRRFPLLPVEEEGRLTDPRLRENFVERVFAYRAWKEFLSERYSRGALVAFHTRHKFLILSHSPAGYTELGRIVAQAKQLGAKETKEQYGTGFMQAMAERTTTRKHTNVLQHLAGHFKKSLDTESRNELHESIQHYRRGLVPLVVPVTLLKSAARRANATYVADQLYLNPHPVELMLRNHV